MDWDFIVLVGTILFFAAMHQWPPDGRRWQREELDARDRARQTPKLTDAEAAAEDHSRAA